MDTTLQVNKGKSLTIEAGGNIYARIPVRTHVITDADNLSAVFIRYVKPMLQEDDIVFISETAVACAQGRAIPIENIRPRPLARFLTRFVYKNPHGIGLSMPVTMEMALRECGTLRILFAAGISLIGKMLGKRGWFYIVAGEKARSIDGPADYVLPPYNKYVVLGPKDPYGTTREIAEAVGHTVAIVDANDFGCNVLGIFPSSPLLSCLPQILRDNPLGQTNEQTPIGIIRKMT